MDDGTRCALQRFERAADQGLARLRQHLDGHVIGNQVLVDQLAHEVELGLRCRGKADLDLLETDLHKHLEHAQLALNVHRLDQRLVAVTQVGAQPDGSLGDHGIRPGAICQAYRLERWIFACRILEHHDGGLSGEVDTSKPKQNGPLLVQTGR